MWPGYQLITFYDPLSPDDGMRYSMSQIVNCSMDITLNQYPDVPLQDSVISHDLLIDLIILTNSKRSLAILPPINGLSHNSRRVHQIPSK